MRTSMTIEDILSSSRNSVQQSKTASASQSKKQQSAANSDFGAILDSMTGEKTAGVREQFTKDEVAMALQNKIAELATINQSSLIKEAQLIGAAVYDGILSRANETEYAAEKVAQVMNIEDPDLNSIAENLGIQEGMKIAMALAESEIAEGQQLAMSELTNAKVASYNMGHIGTLQWLSGFAR